MLEIGTLVDGKYKILNKVGQGGMSVVYLAMNEKANKQWAIKEVRKDGIKDFEVVMQGLIVETDLLKRLSHHNLPSIIDVIEDEETLLIVMDYIEGKPLKQLLEEEGVVPQDYVIEWAKQLCDVLGYLHTQTPPIIYRDMKPANVMLKPDGNIMLIDFGTAREFKEKNVADTTCLGTIGYAAPEQFAGAGMGQTDVRTDIYCLGATLYHLATGMNPSEPPYEIKPVCEINPKLSSGLEYIILKCTQRNPEERYQSMAELMYALKHVDEMDYNYQKKQKGKLAVFITSLFLTCISAVISIWGYFSAIEEKAKNYDYILTNAQNIDDYFNAIIIDPSKTEAYSKFVDYILLDGEMTVDESNIVRKLVSGLDITDKNGYSSSVDVLLAFRQSNLDGYIDICYEIGTAYLFNYNVSVEKDRYLAAAEWLEKTTEKYPIAQIYCDISFCLNSIHKYKSAQVKQTSRLYNEYENLWNKINELQEKTIEAEDIDSSIQVWKLLVDMISRNVNEFTEVVEKEIIINMLDSIEEETENITHIVLQEDMKLLQEQIYIVRAKVKSSKYQGGGN